MHQTRLLIKPTPTATRLLLANDDQELLKAVLPPPRRAHPRAAPTLSEALSLWFQEPLSVVLFVDARENSYALDLCDAFGYGASTMHYEVELVDPTRKRRPLGSFRDIRQLELRGTR